MITTVTGGFSSFDATIETEGDNFLTAKVNFTADTGSVSTGNTDRDTHMKSTDFFDIANYPKLQFVSTKLEKLGNEKAYKMCGDITIRDITKNICLDVDFSGIVLDPWGSHKAGFVITGKIDRRDFGLRWNVITDAGSILVGEEAKISCEVQLVEQK
jgi:polyisoprenoid-binding protein YceI